MERRWNELEGENVSFGVSRDSESRSGGDSRAVAPAQVIAERAQLTCQAPRKLIPPRH
jgi:hypothetical protein